MSSVREQLKTLHTFYADASKINKNERYVLNTVQKINKYKTLSCSKKNYSLIISEDVYFTINDSLAKLTLKLQKTINDNDKSELYFSLLSKITKILMTLIQNIESDMFNEKNTFDLAGELAVCVSEIE
jgi:hypothetical protein